MLLHVPLPEFTIQVGIINVHLQDSCEDQTGHRMFTVATSMTGESGQRRPSVCTCTGSHLTWSFCLNSPCVKVSAGGLLQSWNTGFALKALRLAGRHLENLPFQVLEQWQEV